MNTAQVIDALCDRIEADTGSPIDRTNLMVGQVPDFKNIAIDAGPQLFINFAGAANQDDSGGSMIDMFFDLTLIGNRNAETDDEVWVARDRLFGDAAPSNGFVPTYGLHRHKLTVTSASDTVALTLLYVEESVVATDDPDNLVAHSMRFRVLVRSI